MISILHDNFPSLHSFFIYRSLQPLRSAVLATVKYSTSSPPRSYLTKLMFSDILSIRAKNGCLRGRTENLLFRSILQEWSQHSCGAVQALFLCPQGSLPEPEAGLVPPHETVLVFLNSLYFIGYTSFLGLPSSVPGDRPRQTEPPVAARFRLEKSECISLLLPKRVPCALILRCTTLSTRLIELAFTSGLAPDRLTLANLALCVNI